MKTSLAETSIVALEILPRGEPFAAQAATAEANLAAEYAAARAELFSDAFRPTTPGAIAMYTALTNNLGRTNYGDRIDELHGRAVTTDPDLARLLRSPEALADIMSAAASCAAPSDHLETHSDAGARAANAARDRHELVIAAQLAAVPGHELELAAKRFLACAALAPRLAAAIALHVEHARAELDRVAAEQRAAARVIVDRTVEVVRAAAATAEDARLKALLATEDYRQIKAAALVARLRLLSVTHIRVGVERALFAVDDLASTAPAMSLEQLAHYEAALPHLEAAR